MKTNLLKITGLLIGLCFVFALLPQSDAVLVWEDDFDDGTLAPEWTVHNGTWSASGNSLEATYVPFSVITRDSDFTRGTRIFDVSIGEISVEMGYRFIVYPIASSLVYWGYVGYDHHGPNYGVGIRCTQYYLYIVETINNVTTELDSYEITDWAEAGWHTINFTLGSNRAVTVRLDGDLVLSATASSSAVPYLPELFFVSAADNVMFDNFEVSDTNEDTTTVTTTTSPTDTSPTTGDTTSPPSPPIDMTTLLVAGGGVAVIVIVAVVVLKKR